MKFSKVLACALAAVTTASMLAACGNGDEGDTTKGTTTNNDLGSSANVEETAGTYLIGGIGPLGKLGALKLEDKVSLKLFKFIAMNAVATGGTSVFNSVSLAAGLLNRDFAKSFDEKYTNKKQNEDRHTILMQE